MATMLGDGGRPEKRVAHDARSSSRRVLRASSMAPGLPGEGPELVRVDRSSPTARGPRSPPWRRRTRRSHPQAIHVPVRDSSRGAAAPPAAWPRPASPRGGRGRGYRRAGHRQSGAGEELERHRDAIAQRRHRRTCPASGRPALLADTLRCPTETTDRLRERRQPPTGSSSMRDLRAVDADLDVDLADAVLELVNVALDAGRGGPAGDLRSAFAPGTPGACAARRRSAGAGRPGLTEVIENAVIRGEGVCALEFDERRAGVGFLVKLDAAPKVRPRRPSPIFGAWRRRGRRSRRCRPDPPRRAVPGATTSARLERRPRGPGGRPERESHARPARHWTSSFSCTDPLLRSSAAPALGRLLRDQPGRADGRRRRRGDEVALKTRGRGRYSPWLRRSAPGLASCAWRVTSRTTSRSKRVLDTIRLEAVGRGDDIVGAPVAGDVSASYGFDGAETVRRS